MEERERLQILGKMREASSRFYVEAVRCGCHAFIEFGGLMEEFISVCEAAEKRGVQNWMHANVHNEVLRYEATNAQYVDEKLRCIFGRPLTWKGEVG